MFFLQLSYRVSNFSEQFFIDGIFYDAVPLFFYEIEVTDILAESIHRFLQLEDTIRTFLRD